MRWVRASGSVSVERQGTGFGRRWQAPGSTSWCRETPGGFSVLVMRGQVLDVERKRGESSRTDAATGEVRQQPYDYRVAYVLDGREVRQCRLDDWEGPELREGDAVVAVVGVRAYRRQGDAMLSWRLLRPFGDVSDSLHDDATAARYV